jgi:hypothetical protein
MSQCLHAAEDMFDMPMPPPSLVSAPKRKSLGDLPDDGPNKRQAVASPGLVSPHGFPLGPAIQPAPGAQPVNILPRPNGYAPGPPVPAPSVAPYNPAPPPRRRGRPSKASQSTKWQVATSPNTPAPIAPSPASAPAPQPESPGLQPPNSKRTKKGLPEIAPRPVHGLPAIEPATRSPAVPGPEYQAWRDETSHRDYYQVQAAEPPARERPASTYPSILPRPPLPPPRELAHPASAHPASAEPRHFTATPPPPSAQEPVKEESQPASTEPIKT